MDKPFDWSAVNPVTKKEKPRCVAAPSGWRFSDLQEALSDRLALDKAELSPLFWALHTSANPLALALKPGQEYAEIL